MNDDPMRPDVMLSAVVLVVDDEPLIRMYARAVLEDAGFAVIEAGNAEEALARLDDRPEISVLFTDINMPGRFDGLELARRVHERRGDVQLIITSGRERPAADQIPDSGAFIAKPYDCTSVARLIRSAQHLA